MNAMTASAPQALATTRASRRRAEEWRLIAAGLLTTLGFAAAFAAWSAMAPLAGAVIVGGAVAVENERKVVQHLEGGIVKEILVRPGSRVAAGEPLLRLADVQADASVVSLRNQLYGDLARIARLTAERAGAAQMSMPKELTARIGEPEVAQRVEPERKLFETRRRVLHEQIALLRAETAHVADERESLARRRSATTDARRAIAEQLAMSESLREQNFVSQARVLELRTQMADAQSRLDESAAQLAQSAQKTTQNELKIATLQQAYMQEATSELRDAERRAAELRERLRPTQDALARSTITAPIAGEIVNLRVHTVGGVVAAREPLMEVVPDNSRLVVKARARPEDIAQLRVGAEVAVQLIAYKRLATPSVAGRLDYVSADALVENTVAGALPYYEVRIVIEKQALIDAGNLSVSPGMPVEAYIKTAERTLTEYLLQPLTQSMRRALREN